MPVTNFTPIDTIQGSEIHNPAPVDVDVAAVANKVTVPTVAAPGNVTSPTPVTFQPVTTGTELDNSTLNQPAQTLADSVNSNEVALVSEINTKLGGFADAVSLALAGVGSGMAEQVGAINAALDELKTEINLALSDVRLKEVQQTSDITTAVNTRVAGLDGNIQKLRLFAESLEIQIVALNDTFATDAELAVKVQAINDLIGSLRNADLDFLTAVDGVVDEVNAMRRVQQKEILVSASTGIFDFVTATEGFGEFNAAGDYSVTAQVINNEKAIAHVYDKTRDGFKIAVKSSGVHFVPQPVDCSVTPVRISVLVSHNKRNPMTFGVDTLTGSFISGNGTDPNTVGA